MKGVGVSRVGLYNFLRPLLAGVLSRYPSCWWSIVRLLELFPDRVRCSPSAPDDKFSVLACEATADSPSGESGSGLMATTGGLLFLETLETPASLVTNSDFSYVSL